MILKIIFLCIVGSTWNMLSDDKETEQRLLTELPTKVSVCSPETFIYENGYWWFIRKGEDWKWYDKESQEWKLWKEPTKSARVMDVDLALVMVYSDSCIPCHRMFPILDALKAKGYKVTLVNSGDPAVRPWIDHYKITGVPFFILNRGHQALETTVGSLTEKEITDWFARIEKKESPSGRFQVCHAQDDLGEEGKKYLVWKLSAPSCGMAWCMVHRGWVQEEVTVKSPQPLNGNCPTGVCPR